MNNFSHLFVQILLLHENENIKQNWTEIGPFS